MYFVKSLATMPHGVFITIPNTFATVNCFTRDQISAMQSNPAWLSNATYLLQNIPRPQPTPVNMLLMNSLSNAVMSSMKTLSNIPPTSTVPPSYCSTINTTSYTPSLLLSIPFNQFVTIPNTFVTVNCFTKDQITALQNNKASMSNAMYLISTMPKPPLSPLNTHLMSWLSNTTMAMAKTTSNLVTIDMAKSASNDLNLLGLRVWFDGADINGNGTKPTNGSIVTTWKDKSGLSNNATGLNSPSYSNNSVNFNGTNQYFTLPNGAYPFGNSPFSFYIVLNINSAAITNDQQGIGFFGSGLGKVSAAGWTGTTNKTMGVRTLENGINSYLWGDGNTKRTSGLTLTKSSNFLAEFIYNPVTRIHTIHVNGIKYFTGTTPSYASIPNTGNILGNAVGGTKFMNGTISEFLVYNVAHTDADRIRIEKYLTDKWITVPKVGGYRRKGRSRPRPPPRSRCRSRRNRKVSKPSSRRRHR
jgi:hypothetical protein